MLKKFVLLTLVSLSSASNASTASTAATSVAKRVSTNTSTISKIDGEWVFKATSNDELKY